MRIAALAFSFVALIASAAHAEPVTYQCTNIGSNSFVLQDDAVVPGQFGGQAETALVIDWQAHRMRLGSGTEMPMIANDQGVVGILRTITPAQPPRTPAQQVFITYTLIRATGRLTSDAHIVMSDTMFSVTIAYQCRTEGGATTF